MNGSKNNKSLRGRLTLTLIVVTVALLVWLGLRPIRLAKQTPVAPVDSTTSSLDLSPSPTQNAQPDATRLQKPGGPYISSDPRWAIARERDKMDSNWEWKMPINFYGRVVDENDRPIPAAKVEFSWTDISPAGNSTGATTSSSDGTFSLQGKIGRVLQVDVSKDGFYKIRSERLKSFDYAGFWEPNYHEPDPARPVTFHLRKKGTGETLSAGETQTPISADGTPVRVNLLEGGRVSTDGQIEITAVTNTEKYPPRSFDWQASIAVPDGGLIENNLEFPFEAPEGGYESKVEFKMPANSPDWTRSIEKSYFIRFGSPPNYGRIHIRFNGASQKVSMHYAVNPAGSRKLEAYTDGEFSSP